MGQPIVFLHGAFCGGWAFDAFRRPFEAAGYETHAPHLPHHDRGADMEALARCGVRDYAQAIADFISGLETPPILVGHSLGGLIAQITATRAPCAGLVLLGSSAPWGVMPTTIDEHGNSFGLSLLGDYWRRPVPPDYRVARQTTLDRLPREQARKTFARFAPESGRVIFEAVQWWLDPATSSAAPVYRISAPVLAVSGGVDRVNPTPTIRRIVNRFPAGQAELVEFADMSHWLIGEPEWPQVADRVLAWLKAQDLRADGGQSGKGRRKPLRLFSWGLPPGA